MEFILAFITLALLEVVLGIDNVIFISIVSNKLEAKKQKKAIFWGILGAIIARTSLLLLLIWLIDHLTTPLFPLKNMDYLQTITEYKNAELLSTKLSLFIHTISVREIILFAGGLFLLIKSVSEMHHKMEGAAKEIEPKTQSLLSIVLQIIAVDLVFSFDSILTAIGITHNIPAMILAIIVSVSFMMYFTNKLNHFMQKHPSLEILALSFLILIGFTLILSAMHIDVPHGYIYFALFFSMAVELVNMHIQKHKQPVKLNPKIKDELKDK